MSVNSVSDDCDIRIFSMDVLANNVCEEIITIANGAIARDGYFSVGVSGGSLPNFVKPLANERYSSRIDVSKWRVVFVDERCVIHESEDSNYKAFRDFFRQVGIPNENIAIIDNDLVNGDISAIAVAYERRFGEVIPRSSNFLIHLSLLGMGPDGHTASLFPGIEEKHALAEKSLIITIENSPKPPPRRITMSLPALNQSEKVIYVVTGAAKTPVLSEFLKIEQTLGNGKHVGTCSKHPGYPSSWVRAVQSPVIWFLDDGAAEKIPKA